MAESDVSTEGLFRCARCGASEPRLTSAPIPGPTGEELKEKICTSCWSEWEKAEVMVINELRLNFMDPRSQAILDKHMREFFMLETPDVEPRQPG